MTSSELTRNISTNQLRDINSFDAALELMRETYGSDAVQLASDALGDGFALVKEKDSLIGVPLAFIMWSETSADAPGSLGEFGFIAARVITQDGRKLVITDGSGTGINMQLRQFSADNGRSGGLVAKNGLRRSDYTFTDDRGKEQSASTYYVDTSA